MAEKTPLYMDINNVYSGDEMGLPNRDFISEGIVGATDYAVTAGAGNTVNIAAGACWILGDTDTVNQPIYRVINDAVVNKGITPDPTNPRIVLIIGQITDATFSGATRAMVLTALHGTPAGSPVAPALPASAILLATITVPAAAASSAAYTIVDSRSRAKVGAGQAQGGGSITTLFDVQVGRGQSGDPASGAFTIDSNTILGGNIPATYKHLKMIWCARSAVAALFDSCYFRYNADASAGYDYSQEYAQNGTAAAVGSSIGQAQGFFAYVCGNTANANRFSQGEWNIANYLDASNYQQAMNDFGHMDNATNYIYGRVMSSWRVSFAAITRLQLFTSGLGAAPAWMDGSRFTLYGLS